MKEISFFSFVPTTKNQKIVKHHALVFHIHIRKRRSEGSGGWSNFRFKDQNSMRSTTCPITLAMTMIIVAGHNSYQNITIDIKGTGIIMVNL